MRGKLRGLTGRASRIASRPAHRLELSQVSVHHFGNQLLTYSGLFCCANACSVRQHRGLHKTVL